MYQLRNMPFIKFLLAQYIFELNFPIGIGQIVYYFTVERRPMTSRTIDENTESIIQYN